MVAQIGEQRVGRVHADIGGDQDGFQFLVEIVVYLAVATEQVGQLAAGARQSGSQLPDPAGTGLVSGGLVDVRLVIFFSGS